MNNAHNSARILVVSHKSSAFDQLWGVSKATSWQLEIASSGLEALERLEMAPSPDLVLLDVSQGHDDGPYTFRWLRRMHPELSVIVVTDSADNPVLQQGAYAGATDYLINSCGELELTTAIKLHLSRRAHSALDRFGELDHLLDTLSGDPAIERLRTRVDQLAQLDCPVLLLGESPGKQVVARFIHELSGRRGSAFLAVKCTGRSFNYLERELFGSSSTVSHTRGKFEQCKGGSLFLDDIAAIPIFLQERLLTIVGQSQCVSSGTSATLDCSVRVLAAVNADLEKALADKLLSEELYYYLSPFPVYVPPFPDLKKERIIEDARGLKSFVKNIKGEAEKKAIAEALAETQWNRKAAARLLQISYRALLYKIRAYEMRPPNECVSPGISHAGS